MTILYVAINGKFAGKIAISDELKEDAKFTVAKLKNMGINVFMLTGDRKESAEESGSKLGISNYFAELLPEEKVSMYEKIASKERKTVFVGDGVNDAPVLARADIGISMGGAGSDAAIEASDIVIIGDEVKKCSDAVEIALTTKRIVIQNIVFALSVKIGVIILGIFGIANMWTAVFADVGVALIAILNASRGIK
jgi:Cd2+/Zn2+-exporting ATPase